MNPSYPCRAPHRLRRMSGRDPHEPHRVSTGLELLFDLTFAIAFGQAGNGAAHLISEGHIAPALVGFVFAIFGVCWAWINFTWFASAYDTDDWLYRITTMLQMLGVLVFASGLPAMFRSVDEGRHLDNRLNVAGYVVMRLAMVSQWLRAAREDPPRRRTCLAYAAVIAGAQAGWVLMLFLDLSLGAALAFSLVLGTIELLGPYFAERFAGTPWHPHHIAERYSLLVIITFGECLIGTIAAISAASNRNGWTLDAALAGLAGTLLTFGLWWMYTVLPSGALLHRKRERSFVWGYGHILVFLAIAAVGAGLHVAANIIDGESHLPAEAGVACVVVPLVLFNLCMGYLYYSLVGRGNFGWILWAATFAVYGGACWLASHGARLAVCLSVIALAPLLTILADEAGGGSEFDA